MCPATRTGAWLHRLLFTYRLRSSRRGRGARRRVMWMCVIVQSRDPPPGSIRGFRRGPPRRRLTAARNAARLSTPVAVARLPSRNGLLHPVRAVAVRCLDMVARRAAGRRRASSIDASQAAPSTSPLATPNSRSCPCLVARAATVLTSASCRRTCIRLWLVQTGRCRRHRRCRQPLRALHHASDRADARVCVCVCVCVCGCVCVSPCVSP